MKLGQKTQSSNVPRREKELDVLLVEVDIESNPKKVNQISKKYFYLLFLYDVQLC